MAAHMTFQPGAVLAAADLNEALNPATAPHIPYATATGTVDIGAQTARAANQVVRFPTGRFSRPPIVIMTLATGGGNDRAVIATSGITATQFTAHFIGTAGGTLSGQYCIANWVAIQMEG